MHTGPSGCDDACGSTAANDECGVCDGDNSSCADCAGTPNGDASLDECGECGGSGIAANSSIRANDAYVASTGFGLGEYEASYSPRPNPVDATYASLARMLLLAAIPLPPHSPHSSRLASPLGVPAQSAQLELSPSQTPHSSLAAVEPQASSQPEGPVCTIHTYI